MVLVACRPPTNKDGLSATPLPGTAVAATAPITRLSATPAFTATARPESTAVPRETPSPAPARVISATPTAQPSATPTYATHVVQTEETLLGIAAQYGVTVADIVAVNSLANANFLQLGQALKIPAPPAATATPIFASRDYGYTIIGYTVEGRAIEVFSFGEGSQNVVLVGGMHGGYEWNTVLLAYQVIDFFNGNRDQIPPEVTVHILPVANPDGLFLVTGIEGRFSPEWLGDAPRAARFNANGVDLNRNWPCNWSAAARWGGTYVDPGSEPFSEPETRALRDFFSGLAPRAVLFWHSAAGGLVATGTCAGSDAGSGQVAEAYAAAAGYTVGPFTAYEISGSASDWLVSQGIPAFAVELYTHESTEYGRNLAGVQAMLGLYGQLDGGEGNEALE